MERRNKGQKVVSNGVASRLSFVPEHGTSGTKYGFCGTEWRLGGFRYAVSSISFFLGEVNRYFYKPRFIFYCLLSNSRWNFSRSICFSLSLIYRDCGLFPFRVLQALHATIRLLGVNCPSALSGIIWSR
jgi:hypothetical protein